MFKFLFGGVSLKKLVMERVNDKINEYQVKLDENLAELKFNRKTSLIGAFETYIDKVDKINDDYESNKEKFIDTHVTNLLNKII